MADPFTAATGAVAVAGFALQSVQQLSSLIDGISNAPDKIKALRRDLKALQGNLDNLQMQFDDEDGRSRAVAASKELLDTLNNCSTDCQDFQTKLSGWTKHSKEEQIDLRDRFNVAWRTNAISAFHERLMHSKASLSLALTTLSLQQVQQIQGTTADTKALVVQTKTLITKHQDDVEKEMNAVATRVEALNARSIPPANDYDSKEEELAEARRMARLLQSCRSTDEQIASVVKDMMVKLDISDVTLEEHTKVLVGLTNVESGTANIDAKIRNVKASGKSKGMVGMGQNIDTSKFWD